MTQRTWLITGVNSGFGRHMTEQLLARGDRLWLAHLDVTGTAAIKQVVGKAFADLA
jgi:NAD(P)-dependent dehydrogenase (short-subunit alcohol dehydrogenase family)